MEIPSAQQIEEIRETASKSTDQDPMMQIGKSRVLYFLDLLEVVDDYTRTIAHLSRGSGRIIEQIKMLKGGVYGDIQKERGRQDTKWGGPGHDDTHLPVDWTNLISGHLDDTCFADAAGNGKEYRKELIQIAAIACAAVESLDRKKSSIAYKKETDFVDKPEEEAFTPLKPHLGRIENWYKKPSNGGLGYYICGTSEGHPQYDGKWFHTSYVVSRVGDVITTANSQYTLGKEAAHAGG